MNEVFDIETGPLPDVELTKLMPEFKAPSNYKDEAKITAYIAEARQQWIQNAALSALTGRVLAIGFNRDGETQVFGVDEEDDLLNLFWDKWELQTSQKWIGFCVKFFDLPFLIQRSWIKRVRVPHDVMQGRYFSDRIIDLQERWLCFNRQSTGASLDSICRACGIGQKTGNGKDFALLWQTDRDAAIEYLKSDIRLTAALATRLGV